MDFETYFKNILNDLKVELSDEFDRNFERKAFFDKKWPESKTVTGNKGSLLLRTGAGRRSIQSTIEGYNIAWRSSLPYMAIHNEGGEITVTPKMIKFFWAMYYKSTGALSKTATGTISNNQRNISLSNEAKVWKALALMKPGSKIKIPERRFIGPHPIVDKAIDRVIDENVQQMNDELAKELQNQINK